MIFENGDIVTSHPIGSKESFTGTVVGIGNHDTYTVRDFYGLLWHRAGCDLIGGSK